MNDVLPKTVAHDNNPDSDWGVVISYDYTPIREYLSGVEGIEWRETAKGIFRIRRGRDVYTYWPKTGKWRARGYSPIYRSRSVNQFIEDYVLKTGQRDG